MYRDWYRNPERIVNTADPGSFRGLTVIIVNFRTAHLVLECLSHLKAFPATAIKTQIVVVDNGSNDGSLERIGVAHPDVQLIDAGGNVGFARGNNLALQEVATEYVLLINSDALMEQGTLDAMIAAMQVDPNVGMVGPRIVNVDDGRDQDYPDRFPTIAQMFRRALAGPQFPACGHDGPVEIERIHGACLMARTVVLKQVGLLDERFFMYDEDVDWCVRARKAGWRLMLLPQVRVRHYGGKTSGRKPNGKREESAPGEGSLRMRYELRRSRYVLYRRASDHP